MSTKLTDKIKDWLLAQGYPLEMQVARAFEHAGFAVTQSDYYTDPSTQKPREIDVVAWIPTQIGSVLVRTDVVIECNTKSH